MKTMTLKVWCQFFLVNIFQIERFYLLLFYLIKEFWIKDNNMIGLANKTLLVLLRIWQPEDSTHVMNRSDPIFWHSTFFIQKFREKNLSFYVTRTKNWPRKFLFVFPLMTIWTSNRESKDLPLTCFLIEDIWEYCMRSNHFFIHFLNQSFKHFFFHRSPKQLLNVMFSLK
jgi:hypothetical protein